jgi:cardiolipin synthase
LIPIRLPRAARSAVYVSLATALAVAALGSWWLLATRAAGDPPLARFVVWTIFGGVATASLSMALSRTFRVVSDVTGGEATRPVTSDTAQRSLGLPNTLTLLRFVLIAPTVVLLGAKRYPEALACYVVLFATDVADGVIARRRRAASDFGVVADPLADVLSTFAVFSVLWSQGLCPLWLYALLAFRYAMLLVGVLGLYLAFGPRPLPATVPGKIVGVVQSAGACLLIAGAGAGGLPAAAEGVLFAFLGIGFASIVVSQAVIGWRLVRRRVSSRGPTR